MKPTKRNPDIERAAAVAQHDWNGMIECISQRTIDEERVLIKQAQRGDAKATEILVRATYGLVLYYAKRMRTHQHALDDLIAVGCEGILIAIRKVDPTQRRAFATYAVYWIRAKMHRYALADTVIHFPFRRKLSLADHGVSLNEPVAEMNSLTRGELLVDDAPLSEDVVDTKRTVSDAMQTLTERERIVLARRVGEEWSFTEIGAALSLSGARIQQIEEAALQKLRTHFGLRSVPKYKRQVICRRCGEPGHYTPTCPKPGQRHNGVSDVQEDPLLKVLIGPLISSRSSR